MSCSTRLADCWPAVCSLRLPAPSSSAPRAPERTVPRSTGFALADVVAACDQDLAGRARSQATAPARASVSDRPLPVSVVNVSVAGLNSSALDRNWVLAFRAARDQDLAAGQLGRGRVRAWFGLFSDFRVEETRPPG